MLCIWLRDGCIICIGKVRRQEHRPTEILSNHSSKLKRERNKVQMNEGEKEINDWKKNKEEKKKERKKGEKKNAQEEKHKTRINWK